MEKINRILSHPLWREALEQITELERDRIFCRHTAEHFLDTARIAYIEDLEQGLGVERELIYAAALLHDIGRARQYREGIPHDQAGAELAERILSDCGFPREQREAVCEAILAHRNPGTEGRKDLAGLLYRADKASRMCMLCPARAQCNWSEEKKNLFLKV